MAGVISLKHERFDAAEHFLMNACSKQSKLGHYFGKYVAEPLQG